eukprot:TRINITY_DN1619_c0_g1_i3.p1 TRINITY_DN1619_c0_g1~~TRINITY_DN1619_c0_g1_i3.p1  ORF type:complete len:173 (-),score=5.72 TRINITY_DN1619_c0_g1_i3:367-885(-)
MMKFFAENTEQLNLLAGTTVILPVVTIGNVGQLAIDLVMHSCGFKKLGALESDAVVPVVGRDAFSTSSPDFTTSLEVFFLASASLTVVQQRSPVVKGQTAQFVQEMWAWIEEMGFKQVIVLGSLDASRRLDFHLAGCVSRAFVVRACVCVRACCLLTSFFLRSWPICELSAG